MELDENHVYTLDNKTYTSVTTLVHCCFSIFDADKILEKMRIKGSKYDGMSKEEIKESWNKNAIEAQQQGTRMHAVIERYYKKEPITEEEWILPELQQFKVFTEMNELTPYGIEWRIYMESIQLAGTIDFAALNKDGTLDLYDWKRAKQMDVHNSYNKYSPIVHHIPDTNYGHYTVQLNLYKYMIEQKYNKKVKHMYLVCMYPTQMSFQQYEVQDIQTDIPTILKLLKQSTP
jgi:ATP-dependent exoDNAse (exonuclease V) beta subunit